MKLQGKFERDALEMPCHALATQHRILKPFLTFKELLTVLERKLYFSLGCFASS
jgi:hypothetical protein